MYGQMSGVCFNPTKKCNSWWPWSHRLIVPWDCDAKTVKQQVKKYKRDCVKRRGGYLNIFINYWYQWWFTFKVFKLPSYKRKLINMVIR